MTNTKKLNQEQIEEYRTTVGYVLDTYEEKLSRCFEMSIDMTTTISWDYEKDAEEIFNEIVESRDIKGTWNKIEEN